MIARLLVAVLLALATLWVLPAPASACDCTALTEAEHAANANVVFTGTIIDDQQGEPRTLTFRVDRVYRGEAITTQTVTTAGTGGACGLSIDGAGPYLVFARAEQTGLAADQCGGTRLGSAPAGLGLGQPPQPDPTRTDPGPAAGYWIPVIGLALAATAAGVVGLSLFRRRPR